MNTFLLSLCKERFLLCTVRPLETGFANIFKGTNTTLKVKSFKQLEEKLLLISNTGDFADI